MHAAAAVPDRSVTRFEQRSVADVAALWGDREGERPFAVVRRRQSETNADLYEQLSAPAARAMTAEPIAEA